MLRLDKWRCTECEYENSLDMNTISDLIYSWPSDLILNIKNQDLWLEFQTFPQIPQEHSFREYGDSVTVFSFIMVMFRSVCIHLCYNITYLLSTIICGTENLKKHWHGDTHGSWSGLKFFCITKSSNHNRPFSPYQ